MVAAALRIGDLSVSASQSDGLLRMCQQCGRLAWFTASPSPPTVNGDATFLLLRRPCRYPYAAAAGGQCIVSFLCRGKSRNHNRMHKVLPGRRSPKDGEFFSTPVSWLGCPGRMPLSPKEWKKQLALECQGLSSSSRSPHAEHGCLAPTGESLWLAPEAGITARPFSLSSRKLTSLPHWARQSNRCIHRDQGPLPDTNQG